ncbi:hypothetical protein [Candidatus Paracaedibacter symbiosus]|nr:hypothetical protein [Candidatus Paracaedibacter symbiosus]
MEVEKKDTSFNFEGFKNQAISDLKAGKMLVGKDGILTPVNNGLKLTHF